MPGAVGAQLAVLAQDAELDREPEDVGERPAAPRRSARAARPGRPRRLSAAKRGLASRFPWPMTSWMMSGSGV